MVTAVMPDGEIKYTQHSGDLQNASLQGRLPNFTKDLGQQQIIAIRPNPPAADSPPDYPF